MSVSSEKFELSQDDLEILLEQIVEDLDQMESRMGVTHRAPRHATQLWKECEARTKSRLAECRSLIQEMDGEARMAPAAYRSGMTEKVRGYREAVAKVQNQMARLSDVIRQQKSSTMSAAGGGGGDSRLLTNEEIHRRQVQEGSLILDRTTQSLLRSQQVAFESEEVGNEIVSDLGVQRETLERTRTRLQETNAEISRSRKVVRRIYFGVIKNKVVLVGIIIIELAIIASLVYMKFIARKST